MKKNLYKMMSEKKRLQREMRDLDKNIAELDIKLTDVDEQMAVRIKEGKADMSHLDFTKLTGSRNTSVLLGGVKPTPDMVLHPDKPLTTTIIVEDLERLMRGRGEKFESDFVRQCLRDAGYDPDNVAGMAALAAWRARAMLHDSIVGRLQRELRSRSNSGGFDLESTYEAILAGQDDDPVIWNGDMPTTIGRVRHHLGMSIEAFVRLEKKERLRVLKKVTHRVRIDTERARVEEAATKGRSEVFDRLRDEWSKGPLTLERPPGSSLHLMLDYDRECTKGDFALGLDKDDIQIVVVENDWGASVPPVTGEWRVPYPFMCWEFRITGVRVLAFTVADEDTHTGRPEMFCVYGSGGHWVMDDFFYNLGDAGLPRGLPHEMRGGSFVTGTPSFEFRRVADIVYRGIRSMCIMMEAEVACRETVKASGKLQQKRRDEGKRPLRDYYTVRLFNTVKRKYVERIRMAGRATDSRAPQRGHWRAGTWVHFDDQDSGREQYVNDGGFVVSKTWRKWHFAGDPNNIIHKELRA